MSGLIRIVRQSCCIIIAAQNKKVPIFGRLSTIKVVVGLEPLFFLSDTIAQGFVTATIMQLSVSQLVILTAPSLIILVLVALINYLIPQMPKNVTTVVLALCTQVAAYVFLVSAQAPVLIQITYTMTILAQILQIFGSLQQKYDIQTRRLSLACKLIPKARFGVPDAVQALEVIALVLLYSQCFVSFHI